jgi:hypothetical protein
MRNLRFPKIARRIKLLDSTFVVLKNFTAVEMRLHCKFHVLVHFSPFNAQFSSFSTSLSPSIRFSLFFFSSCLNATPIIHDHWRFRSEYCTTQRGKLSLSFSFLGCNPMFLAAVFLPKLSWLKFSLGL